MILAVVLIVVAALSLALILRIAIVGSLQIRKGESVAENIQPIDVEAFRNLVSPSEREYLRRHLTPAQFRVVQRLRLRATAAYVQEVARNAAVLIHIGQAALATTDPLTQQAARELVSQALLVRRNAALALIRIYVTLALPTATLEAAGILANYERLSGSAMLLGRLQNPSTPVRLSAQ